MILYGGMGFILALFSAALFLYIFPPIHLAGLWERELMGIPFILLFFGIFVTIGAGWGFLSGLSEMQRFQMVEQFLDNNISLDGNLPEEMMHPAMEGVFRKLAVLKKQMREMTATLQKLASEKANFEENKIHEIINEERHRLARELHDSVSQQLFAASMLMSAVNEAVKQGKEPADKQLKMVERMIQESQMEMRALLLHLRPVALKDKSLKEGIEDLLSELKQKVPLDIQWKVEDVSLERGLEDNLFRILQESVSNTLRHAQAKRLDVLLVARDQFIIMRLTDDGIGFRVNETKTGSYGLQNIRERAQAIGGSLHMVSMPGRGTRIEIKVPHLSAGATRQAADREK